MVLLYVAENDEKKNENIITSSKDRREKIAQYINNVI